MCTAVILRRPDHRWPLVFAANRDEMNDRPWQPPGRHWPDREEVVAGLDELAGGSWLGLNDHGLLAAALNRMGSLGPQAGKRSRGELVLEALDHADAAAATRALSQLNSAAYRSFNLVVADAEQAFWLRNLGVEAPGEGEDQDGRIEAFELPPGLSMLTAYDRNDLHSPRIFANLDLFKAAAEPQPEAGDWTAWQRLLSSRLYPDGLGPEAAMTVVTESGFETTSSSLIALPAPSLSTVPPSPVPSPVWLFAPGRPDRTAYEPVTLE